MSDEQMPNWPASKIVIKPISDLKEAAQNSRVHSDEQIAEIAKSINKFGWTIPCLIDEEGTLIAGHARVRAALTQGISVVPCMIAQGWSAAEKEAYQIADNRLAEKSTWDDKVLTAQIRRLSAADFDLGVLGLDLEKFDLGDAFNPENAPQIDTGTVTQDQVDKKKAQMGGAFSEAKDKETYEIVCPHCGGEFDVEL